MIDEMIPIVLFISLAFVIVTVARISSDWLTRRQIIRSGVSAEQAQSILATAAKDPDRPGALKWGLVSVGVGAALIVLQFLPYRTEDPIALGMVLLAGGAGLLAYFRVTAGQG